MNSEARSTRQAAPVQGREIGAQISGVFGTVFVWMNSGGLPAALRVALVILAVCALVVIVFLSIRSYHAQRVGTQESARDHESGERRQGPPFGWPYWIIVIIEVILLVGGSRLITSWGYPELGVAWVAVVVGTHFFALARIFRLVRFHLLGASVTLLGVAGFVLRPLGALDAIAVVSGIASGLVLLAFGLWAFTPDRSQPSA